MIRRGVWLMAALLLPWWMAAAHAQDPVAGQAYFNANCTSSGCHTGGPTSPFPAARNGGGASSIIAYAANQGMVALPSATNLNNLQAYLAGFVASPFPTNASIPFNPGGGSFTTLATQVVLGTSWGALAGVATTGAAPSRGSVSYVGSDMRYTATACQVGADSWNYRGSGSGGFTSTRQATVTIANPTSPTAINSIAPPAGVTGLAYSHDVNVAACEAIITYSIVGSLPPGLAINPSSGVISGTPTTTIGSPFTGTIRATYPGGQFATQAFSIAVTLGPPVITSAATAANSAVGVVYGGYTVTATNAPHSSYGATGLPPGLAITPATGAITGTPTSAAGSPYLATVSATNATGTGNQPVNFNVVPEINSAATASGQTGVVFSYSITEAAGPAYTNHAALDPLPAGLSLAGPSGIISGTPTAVGGPTNVRLRGSNAFGNGAEFTLAITITLGPPVVTSAAVAAGVTIPFNYQILATNPPHSSFGASGLPNGLSLDAATGIVSGTPQPGSGGVYPVAITATNATSTGNGTLTITVAESAPVITSSGTASGTTGVAFNYQILATNGTTSFGAAGLPPGLSIDTTTGAISGIPSAAGTFNGTITATNGAGSDTDNIAYTIALGPPVITSAAAAGGAVGFLLSYQITATSPPHSSFGATGLPPGLAVNASGLVSGTPTAVGVYNATVSATNATATANQGVVFTIGVGIPVIDSASTAEGGTNAPFSYQISANNAPTSFNATGLPGGLTVSTTTGLISGTPTAEGVYSVNLSATNATGTGTRALTLTILLQAPVVPGPNAAGGFVGAGFAFQVPAINGATGFTATGLPPGLAINPTSGLISGVPTQGGIFNVGVAVTNAAGTTQFALTINIAFVLATVSDVVVEVPFEQATPIALPVVGQVNSINIVSLPEHGLVTVDAATRTATYAPATDYSGPDAFTYSATNPAGTSTTATVTISVGTFAPVAGPGSVTVELNTPTTFSVSQYVKGSGLTGVTIRSRPAHGSVAVNGMQVTYTPRTDFFGADTFTYVAFGNVGTSSVGTITVNVVGRPDPGADRDVVGLVDAQNQAARRFARAQIGNIQRRMESLHRSEPVPPAAPTPAPASASRREPPVRVASATPAVASDVLPVSLITTLMQATTSRSLDVAGTSQPAGTGMTLWIAGTANFGNRDADGGRSGLRFGTDGISAGADRRFGSRLAAGVGVGFARDDTEVGTAGTRSKATGASIAGYASYQPTPRSFVDALVGYGHLRFDSDRHVAAIDEVASARRKGRQFFGSVAAGYELRRENLLLSPYGRLDFSLDRLDRVSESGVGNYALEFATQDQRSFQAAVGVRAESRHETDFGWAIPRARAEYRRELEGDRAAGVSYADLPGGTLYSVTPAGTSRNALLLGIGADLMFRGGLKIGIDYTAQRASGAANVQGVRVLVSHDLDALGASAWRWEPTMLRFPINVDAGYTWDDNVNRARESGQRRTDNVFSMSANSSRPFQLGGNARVMATALLSGEKLERHAGLGRFSGGAQAEVQYRASGAFDATTFSLVGRALYEQYESRLRSGPRYFVGVNARRALTDRIEVFAELGANLRHGKSDVFNWRDYAAKVNVDYSLGRKGIVYVAGEYRRGDTVSSGLPSLVNVGLAEVFVPDDAFDGADLVAYRFDARSIFSTVGFNYPLGARDSIDVSWRRVQATPVKRPAFDFSESLRYIDNQYSLVYLMRF